MASEQNGLGAQDGASQGCVPGTVAQTPVQVIVPLVLRKWAERQHRCTSGLVYWFASMQQACDCKHLPSLFGWIRACCALPQFALKCIRKYMG